MLLSRVLPPLLLLGPGLAALILGGGAPFDPPWLLLPLNLLFLCALPLFVSWLAFSAWRETGVVPILALGAGMWALALAVGASSALMYLAGPNAAMSVHNSGVLIAGLAFLGTSPIGLPARRQLLAARRPSLVAVIFGATALVTGLLVAAVVAGVVPPFFIPGNGPTHLRDLVLGAAILAFGTAALAWWVSFGPDRLPFVRWYALALFLFTLGLLAIHAAQNPGDFPSWLGRGAQYAAGLYFFRALREAGHTRRFAAALLHSALPYRPVVESSTEGIMVLDERGILYYSNEAAQHFLGHDRDTAFGAGLLDLPLAPRDRDALRASLASPGLERLELTLAGRDNRSFPAEISRYRHPADPRLQIWFVRDISRQKEAQQELERHRSHLEELVQERAAALKASEERFRILASSTPDHIFEQDLDLRYTLVINPQLGLTVETMLGRTDAELVSREDAERLTAAKRQVLRTGAPRYFDFAIPSLRGELQWFEGSYVPRHNAAGEIDGLLGYFRNVTDRKLAEQSLRDSERRFRALYSSMNEGVALHELICDAAGHPIDSRIIEVNPAWEQFTGTSREAAVGHTMSEVLPGSLPLIETYARVALTGEPAHFEFYNPQLRRHFEVSAYSPTRGQFAVLLLDRTEDKRRTAALEAANKELETFAYSVSHDLRAPLRAVNGFASMLEEHCAPTVDAEGHHMFEAIRRNSLRMTRLIDDMLAFSRAGRAAIAAAEVDMEKLAHEVADELRPADRDVVVIVHSMPRVHGDEAMLRQVWFNLLANALKFTTRRTDAVIELGGTESGGRCRYYVRDNGVGFDMAFAGKLFGVFQRLHPAEEFDGTGIGLAIVDRIVKRHGGAVHAEGKVGEGAEFRFELPAEGPAPE